MLELFTSQGCSSCPPADALLKSYGDSDEVIALSLPVDYWDYLGWKDTLASSKFSERQRAYARRRGDGAVYTPQVIVNGTAHVVGSDREQIERALAADQARFSAGQVPVRFWLRGGTIVIETGAGARRHTGQGRHHLARRRAEARRGADPEGREPRQDGRLHQRRA